MEKFFGKYRATVINNIDPEMRGRLILSIPDVLDTQPSSWAEPSAPLAGPKMGVYMIPPEGTGVWVEFEQGNHDYPIWTGCRFVTVLDLPSKPIKSTISHNIIIQSGGQYALSFGDKEGIELSGILGAKIQIKGREIKMSVGKSEIKLSDKGVEISGLVISLNGDALKIT